MRQASVGAAAPTQGLGGPFHPPGFAARERSKEVADALHLDMHPQQAAEQQQQQLDSHGEAMATTGTGGKASSAAATPMP